MPTLNDAQLRIIESTFAKLAPHADALVTRFYQRLFEAHPEVEPLFEGRDMKQQGRHLVAALQLVVANLRKPEQLVPRLRAMGERHVAYGAMPEHYGVVAETLLSTMAELAGKAWTPTVHKAWA
ncbi:MAG: hypothetical protein K1X88_17395, partial [Nannocystaceae bacterium]|nr:hypothetical protein [Nannocystaceae bacterium]